MNEHERSELDHLKSRQARLEEELRSLSQQLRSLDNRLKTPKPTEIRKEPTIVEPSKASIAPESSRSRTETQPAKPLEPQHLQVPPVISEMPARAQSNIEPNWPPINKPSAPTLSVPAERAIISAPEPKSAPQIPPVAMPPSPTGGRSFEMRLGTFWLVRIGIVMLLTGLVFFGNYAYQNYIGRLGAGGKVALLYLASAALLGGGWWWQRKPAKESLKNYAQVLFAGGLAAVYFTTYAAYHFDHLKIISSSSVDSILLLSWAGFIVWIADRKKSEVLALFAILLGYYSAVITNVGIFTLYSNLVLTLAAVFFLIRNRWAALSFISLSATYAAYTYWRFFHGEGWQWPSPSEGLWRGTFFLIAYWLVFTVAVFLSKHEKLIREARASFLTLNNGVFFALFLLTMFQVRHGGFWKFSLIYGTILLLLAGAAHRFLSPEPLARNSYLTQGLLLVTLGFIAKYSGLHLALILAVESAVLLFSGTQTRNRILVIGAYCSACLAILWGMNGMLQHESHGLWLGIVLGLLMMVNTMVVHYASLSATPPTALLAAPERPRIRPAYFTFLALAIWGIATWNNTSAENFPLVLSLEAVVLIGSVYVLRVPEIPLLALGYLALAQVSWSLGTLHPSMDLAWWKPMAMVLMTIALSFWWGKQNALNLREQIAPAWQLVEKVPLIFKDMVLMATVLLAGNLSGGWAPDIVIDSTQKRLFLPLSLCLLTFIEVLVEHRKARTADSLKFRPQVAFATCMGLLSGWIITWNHAPRELLPVVFGLEAILLTLSFYVFLVPEIALFSQVYLLSAQVFWILYNGYGAHALPSWWNPASLIAISLGLSHWWQKQRAIQVRNELKLLCQGLYSLAAVALFFFWLRPQVQASSWLALSGLLAVGLTTYGVLTRSWMLAIFGQFFIVVTTGEFIMQLATARPNWYFPLVPLAALSLLAWSTTNWFRHRPNDSTRVRAPLLQLALVYRWSALLMSVWWVCKYIPERERTWVFIVLGFVVFLGAGWRKNQELLAFGAVFTAAGLVLFWAPQGGIPTVYHLNLMAILLVMLQQRIAKSFDTNYLLDNRIHGGLIIIGGLTLWVFVCRWVIELAGANSDQGSYLTASWSVLALLLFTCGIVLRERVYRWLGLGILACALGRVVIIDVWKLETIFRILSFMALGIVLLVLGFIYNRYQEKIKEWL